MDSDTASHIRSNAVRDSYAKPLYSTLGKIRNWAEAAAVLTEHGDLSKSGLAIRYDNDWGYEEARQSAGDAWYALKPWLAGE